MITKSLQRWSIFIFVLLLSFYFFRQDLVFKPYHYYKSLSANIEQIHICIEDEDYFIIDSLQKDVLKNGKVTNAHKQYIKATILYNGKNHNVKMRLKGDQIDHYKSTPPSYRIKVLDENPILGSKKLSFQSFGVRNFIREWAFNKLLEHNGIMSPKTDVIELTINKNTFISTYEEHFTHFLTDRYNRPHGPIICFNENSFWSNLKTNQFSEEEVYLSTDIKDFKYYAPLDSSEVHKAKKLLNAFRQKTITPDKAFNINQIATFYAICDLTNSHHALRWHNTRFYYNPTLQKLEPIGFDGSSWGLLTKFAFDDEKLTSLRWTSLISNKQFLKAYIKQLELISKEEYIQQFFTQYEDDFYNLSKRIYKKNLFFTGNYKYLYNNASWIRENLEEYRNRLLNNQL